MWCILGTLQIWLNVSIIRIERGYLILRKGILGIGLTKRISKKAIRKIRIERSGNPGDAEESVYYNLVLIKANQKKVKLAIYIKEKHHVHWLASQIRQAIDRSRE